MNTLLPLLRKEFTQFRRNPMLVRLAIAFPILVVLIMPLVANMDVKHVQVAIVDYEQSALSRRITSSLDASPTFSVVAVPTYARAISLIEENRADVILEIPEFKSGRKPQIASNGVNGIKGTLGGAYVMQAVSMILADGNASSGPSTLNLFNPTLDYRFFMIPALMIMLLIMICGFLPALNLASEKEIGTIEQINVTPVSPFTFILSKLIPFWILGVVLLTLCMIIAAAVYGLVPAGSIAAIYLLSLLFIIVISGFGVIIANFSSTMTRAMFLTFFVVMLFILMSGLITPITSMPRWAQCIAWSVPPSYYIEAMRAIYLKGTPMAFLWSNYLALAGFGVAFCAVAALTYRKQS